MYRAELLVKIPSDGFRTNMGLVLLTMLKSPYNPPTDHYHKSVHIVREIEKEGERERERERDQLGTFWTFEAERKPHSVELFRKI